MADDVELEALLQGYYDGSLDGAGCHRLRERIDDAPALARRIADDLRLDGQVREVLRDELAPAEGPRRPSARMHLEALARRIRANRRRRWPLRLALGGGLAAAAALALVLLRPQPLAPGEARLEAQGTVLVDAHPAGRSRVVAPGGTVAVGTDAAATLTWGDGSRLDLAPATTLGLDPGPGKRTTLGLGHLRADIAPQQQPFVMRFGSGSPAQLTVHGTRFEVEATAGRSRVAVERGCVGITCPQKDPFEALLLDGDTWTLGNDEITFTADPTPWRAKGRAEDGLIARWRFDEGGGLVAHDSSGVGAAMDLVIASAEAAELGPQGLAMHRMNGVTHTGRAEKLRRLVDSGKSFSVEILFTAADLVPEDVGVEVFDIHGPDLTHHSLRLSSSLSPVSAGGALTPLRHVVLVYGPDAITTVFDGWARLSIGSPGHTPNYDLIRDLVRADRDLVLSLPATRAAFGSSDESSFVPWSCTYRYLAIYDHALEPTAIRRNALSAP